MIGGRIASRNCWSDYAKAAAEAAPNAQQVADRWHLLKNLREAIERLFERESETIAQALKPAEPTTTPEVVAAEAPATEDQPPAETPSPPQPNDSTGPPTQAEVGPAKRRRVERFRRRENREDEPQARLDAIRGRSAELSAALDLADEFAALIRKLSPGTLTAWLARAEASPCPELRRFAEGIRRDEAAVQAAVSGRWSNGPVEGHVNRLKTIKRQMYGRASFVARR